MSELEFCQQVVGFMRTRDWIVGEFVRQLGRRRSRRRQRALGELSRRAGHWEREVARFQESVPEG
jgi:hypothetical protein